MFVIFDMRSNIPVAAFKQQQDAENYWEKYGGNIIFYPKMREEDIHLPNRMRRSA